jgi:hypothetical protein
MRKPYDHAEDEYPLCSQFADPTKTCGTRWDNKTIVFDENEAWMTDGEHTAHLIYGPVEINPPLDEATTKEWTDAMTKAVNSMRTDDSTGVESYLHRHLDMSARMPRRVTEGCYFEFTDQPATNKPPGFLYRIGPMLTHSYKTNYGWIGVQHKGSLAYDKESGFQKEETWTETALSMIGLGSK